MADADVNIEEIYGELRKRYAELPEQLKPHQITAVKSILAGKNVVANLPPSYGKSLIFTLCPLLQDLVDESKKHAALVISPFPVRMRDQVVKLRSMGIKAAMLASGNLMEAGEKDSIMEGKVTIVFASPEALVVGRTMDMFSRGYQRRFVALTFDDAHCFQMGAFRTNYLKVVRLISLVRCPRLVLSSTVSKSLFAHLKNVLCMFEDDTVTVCEYADRPNLALNIVPQPAQKELKWYLEKLCVEKTDTPKAMIFFQSIATMGKAYIKWLNGLLGAGVNKPKDLISYYYPEADSRSLKDAYTVFLKKASPIRVLFSTIGFGMGVHVEDVRYVMFWGFPDTLADMWQEAVRCATEEGVQGEVHCLAISPEEENELHLMASLIEEKFGANWEATASEEGDEQEQGLKYVMNDKSSCFRKRIVEHLYPLDDGHTFLPPTPSMCSCSNDQCKWQVCPFCKCCNVCRDKCKSVQC